MPRYEIQVTGEVVVEVVEEDHKVVNTALISLIEKMDRAGVAVDRTYVTYIEDDNEAEATGTTV
jgi:hypothetical protein